jgi:hypothetical protein
MAIVGYDCADTINEVYVSAHDEFGVDPDFWMRYFSPSPAADIFSDDAESECEAAWASGGHYVGCVSAPYQSDLSGSSATGQADAQTYAASILSAYDSVGPLDLPSNNALDCLLDQEYSTSLSQPYWDGWSDYIANYNFADLGTYPLYPDVYCTPSAPYPNCSIFAESSGLNVPAMIWVPTPEYCDPLGDPPGTYEPETCSEYSSSTVPTNLWQYAEQGACDWSAAVDLNVCNPDINWDNYCLRILSDP